MRQLSTIAAEIAANWKRPYFGAMPYLQAMFALNSLDDRYGADEAREIVLYFLANATNWRGAKARAIKAELHAMLKQGK